MECGKGNSSPAKKNADNTPLSNTPGWKNFQPVSQNNTHISHKQGVSRTYHENHPQGPVKTPLQKEKEITMATQLETLLNQQDNTDNKNSRAKQDILLQNVTPGFHCVMDKRNGLELNFEPFGVIDLTYFDKTKILSSTPLKQSMINGYLVTITREEHDNILYAESQKQQEDALNSVHPANKTRTKSFNIDGKDFEAEVVNLNKFDSKNDQDKVTSAGQANDPKSFAIAYTRARQEHIAQGMNLTAQNFQHMITQNPNLVKTYMARVRDDAPIKNSVTSGHESKGRFFVAGQPGQVDQFAQPLRGGDSLKNFGNDAQNAQQELYRTAAMVSDAFDPAEESGYDDEGDHPMAQVIDLNQPDDSDDLGGSGPGGIKRL